MTTKKDFIELGEWQLNAFKQRDKYKQALEEIRIEIGDLKDINKLINLQKILEIINEVIK